MNLSPEDHEEVIRLFLETLEGSVAREHQQILHSINFAQNHESSHPHPSTDRVASDSLSVSHDLVLNLGQSSALSPTALLPTPIPINRYHHSQQQQQRHNSFQESQLRFSQSIYSQYASIPLTTPTAYSNLFAIAINSAEVNSLRDFFHHVCSRDVVITRTVYNLKNYTEGKPPINYFGGNYLEFTRDQYLAFYQNFLYLVPDITLDVHSHRMCYEAECTVFICMANYTGTLLSHDTVFVRSNKKGQILEMKDMSDHLTRNVLLSTPRSFNATGSIVMFRNSRGKIYRLEYYIEYL